MNAALPGSIAAAAAAASGLAWAVRGKSARIFGDSVWRGDPSRRQIALTFDDGPSEATLRVLDLLAQHNLPATFFMVGVNVRRFPEIARQVAQAGHEIGNHSDTHPYLHFKSAAFMRKELGAAQESIQQATGITPHWFRAPYGVRWFGLGGVQKELGLTGAMWTTIARDWTLPADAVAQRLIKNAKPGAIFCLHDGRVPEPSPDIRATVDGLAAAIPQLLTEGYEFVTLSDICRNQPS